MKYVWLIVISLLLLTSCSYNQDSFLDDLENALIDLSEDSLSDFFPNDDSLDLAIVEDLTNGFYDSHLIMFSSSDEEGLLSNSEEYEIEMSTFLIQNDTYVLLTGTLSCKKKKCTFSELQIDQSSMIKLPNRDLVTDSGLLLNFANYLEEPLVCYQGVCEKPYYVRSTLIGEEINAVLDCNAEQKQLEQIDVSVKNPCDEYKQISLMYDAYCLEDDLSILVLSAKGSFEGCNDGLMTVNLDSELGSDIYKRYFWSSEK